MATALGVGDQILAQARRNRSTSQLLGDLNDPARIRALLADIVQHTGSLANGISGTDGKILSSEGAGISHGCSATRARTVCQPCSLRKTPLSRTTKSGELTSLIELGVKPKCAPIAQTKCVSSTSIRASITQHLSRSFFDPCTNPFAAGRPLGRLSQSGHRLLPSHIGMDRHANGARLHYLWCVSSARMDP
jgi:hypothetical protein